MWEVRDLLNIGEGIIVVEGCQYNILVIYNVADEFGRVFGVADGFYI